MLNGSQFAFSGCVICFRGSRASSSPPNTSRSPQNLINIPSAQFGFAAAGAVSRVDEWAVSRSISSRTLQQISPLEAFYSPVKVLSALSCRVMSDWEDFPRIEFLLAN
jgi:hypothetical protein